MRKRYNKKKLENGGLNYNDSQNWLRLQAANLELEFTVYLPRKIVDISGDLRKGPGPTDDVIAVVQIETARYVNGQCQFQINRDVSPPAPVTQRFVSTNQTALNNAASDLRYGCVDLVPTGSTSWPLNKWCRRIKAERNPSESGASNIPIQRDMSTEGVHITKFALYLVV